MQKLRDFPFMKMLNKITKKEIEIIIKINIQQDYKVYVKVNCLNIIKKFYNI